jgi:DNA-binding NtrC family response regulator
MAACSIEPECVFHIVAISRYPTQEARVSALAAGCSSFIAQPFDFESLSNLLDHLLPESLQRRSQESRYGVNSAVSEPASNLHSEH